MPQLKIDNETTIHYQCLGQGEDLVLIHGLGANLAFWYMGIARMLARHYRVITYDLRGHGRSSMPDSGYTLTHMAYDLESLLNHLDVEKAHIVGHSFGARVALYFTTARPERVLTMTVADTQVSCLQNQVRLRDWPHWKNWKQQLIQQGFQAFPPEDEYINFQMLMHFNQMSGDFTHGALNQSKRAPSLRRRDMGNKGSARWDRMMATTSAREDFKDDHQITIDNLRTISVPTLSMFGEYSHCLESCRQLNYNVGTSRVKILPEVGHFLPAIKPRLFMYTLRQFMLQFRDGPRQVRTAHERRPFRERRRGERRAYVLNPAPFPYNDRHGDLVLFDRRKPVLLDSRIVSNQ